MGLPYNAGQPREQRRKDIPDAWILEAAIDLARSHPNLVAICLDGKLSDALKAIPIVAFETASDFLELFEPSITEQPATTTPGSASLVVTSVGPTSKLGAAPQEQAAKLLEEAQALSRPLEIKIAGFVTYLAGPTKHQLLELLTRSGVSDEAVNNAIGRLVLTGTIRDTGNHYLPVDRAIGDLAAAAVEGDVIALLNSSSISGH